MPRIIRPPESWSSVAAVIAVIAGVRPGIWKIAEPILIRSVCEAHARDGQTYDVGLGFYTGRRFHVDSSGFRKWGANGKGATSPCVNYA